METGFRHWMQIVNEAVAPAMLWHRMNLAKFVAAVNADTLDPTWKHSLKQPDGTMREVLGTSMSRNKAFALSHHTMKYQVTLCFDQTSLARQNRILPLNADHAFYGDHESDRYPRKRRPGFEMAEEFVLGKVASLHRCLLAIYLTTLYGGSQFNEEALKLALEYSGGRFPVLVFGRDEKWVQATMAMLDPTTEEDDDGDDPLPAGMSLKDYLAAVADKADAETVRKKEAMRRVIARPLTPP